MGSTLKNDFAGGQGAGAEDYVAYATDLDDNFIAIEGDINTIDAKVQSVVGTNTVLALRSAEINDPIGIGPEVGGVIGAHSYRASVNGGDAKLLDITAGTVLGAGSVLAENVIGQTLAAGTLTVLTEYYISVGINGTMNVPDLLPGQGLADIAKCTTDNTSNPDTEWDPATLKRTGESPGDVSPTVSVLLDGDDVAHIKRRETADSGSPFPDAQYRTVEDRLIAIERLLSGLITDPGTITGPAPTAGVLGPPIMSVMDAATRDALTEVDGMVLYNSDDDAFNFRANSIWFRLPFDVALDTGNAPSTGISHSFAHGLAGIPTDIQVYLQCTTADLNYSIGDIVLINSAAVASGNTGLTISVDATNVVVIISSVGIALVDKTGFGVSAIDAPDWDLVIVARDIRG
jgi:hypothetical protein